MERETVLDIGTTKQLFIDDQIIAQTHGVVCTLNQPANTSAIPSSTRFTRGRAGSNSTAPSCATRPAATSACGTRGWAAWA